jgi:hypothetical protein
MRELTKASMALTAAALLIGLGGTAAAQTWQETLPPQAVVNASLASRDAGTFDKAEGRARLHHEDNQIGQQERETASRTDGNTEDRTLNRPENAISPQLRRE